MEYRIISADSHINEPPGTFVDRVPAHLKDRAPRIVPAEDGGDGWSWDGKPPRQSFGLNALAGRPYEDYKASGIKFEEILPGNYDGAAHIKDMALDGVDASVVYPAAALGIPSGCLYLEVCLLRGALQGVGDYRTVGASLVGERAECRSEQGTRRMVGDLPDHPPHACRDDEASH